MNQSILSDTPLNPVISHKRSFICRKIVSCCHSCGKGWLFDDSISLKSGDHYSNTIWCNSDICGSVCAFFTWLLILHPSLVLMFVVFIPVDSNWFRFINGPIFYFLTAMAVLSHIKSVFTDPGTVVQGNATEENLVRLPISDKPPIRCIKCNSIKPERAHHCSVCQRCVRKMDHHCPWINNCVGEDNQKYFIMFTFYIFLMSSFAMYICVHFFIICVKDEWKDFFKQQDVMLKNWFEFSPLTKSLLLLSVTFESLVFGLFTLIMCGTQLWSVGSDKTGIESLKKETRKLEKRSCWSNITSMFNQPFSWKWFCPFAFKISGKKIYCNNLHVV